MAIKIIGGALYAAYLNLMSIEAKSMDQIFNAVEKISVKNLNFRENKHDEMIPFASFFYSAQLHISY